jgi:polyribonucleotide nucleotidyltransferase
MGQDCQDDMFDIQKAEIEWGGRPLTLETGRIARQADGAVWPPMAKPWFWPRSFPNARPKPALISSR